MGSLLERRRGGVLIKQRHDRRRGVRGLKARLRQRDGRRVAMLLGLLAVEFETHVVSGLSRYTIPWTIHVDYRESKTEVIVQGTRCTYPTQNAAFPCRIYYNI